MKKVFALLAIGGLALGTVGCGETPAPAPTPTVTPADPAATDPAATDPAATDPAATDPAATDPADPAASGEPATP
jgi:streptogrisin D